MERKQQHFRNRLAEGEEGEEHVAGVLLERNNNLVMQPLYQFENTDHAPFLINSSDAYSSPDLICFNDGYSFFIEVKTKNKWVEYNGRRETGFDRRLYDNYSMVYTQTGVDVYVVFNHKTKPPLGLYLAKLEDYTRVWNGKRNGVQKYKPMVFYNYEILTELLPISSNNIQSTN